MKDHLYKNEERKHYDSFYTDEKEYHYPNENEISNNDKVNIAARKYIESKTFEILKDLGQGEILDYGCGIGAKTYKFSSNKWKIAGIDISSKSIEVANDLSKKNGLNATFLVMDCENLTFKDNKFNVIFDYGTFSSLNLDEAIKELCRVLKPDGYLLAIETLGSNPIFIFKRKINALFGLRTKWAVNHILRRKDWRKFEKHFSKFEIKYFSLLTPYLSPFLRLFPEKKHFGIISYFEKIDSKLLKNRFFEKYAFKTVAIFKNPKK